LQTAEVIKLFPDVPTVKVTSTQRDEESGREVSNEITHEIRPFQFPDWFKVAAHTERIIGNVDLSYDLDDPIQLFRMLLAVAAHAGDDVMAILALALKRDIAYFNTLQADDGIKLMQTVFEVNKSFFSQKILPTIQGVKANVKAQLKSEPESQT
jgi:hypothetical protein